MKSSQGRANNIENSILGKITKAGKGIFSRKGYILVTPDAKCGARGYSVVLSSAEEGTGASPHVCGIPTEFVGDLIENDLVLIQPNGTVSVVWESISHQNGLLLTEACNCKCLMCPQPPKAHDVERVRISNATLDALNPKDVTTICLSGGEPTLIKEEYVKTITRVRTKFPKARVTVLTNAKTFEDFDYAKRCAIQGPDNIIYCVSLHSDNNRDHDRIVGVPGSFEKTIKGLTNLAKLRVPIEIRFVVNKINASRMNSFGEFVYRNFPFVAHVAYMSMEIRGLAEDNMSEIWIDPYNYGKEITEAVSRLSIKGIPTSIYNMPLCLLPESGWKFARQSISGWKNDYLPQCEGCAVQRECAGVFTSSTRQSEHISPLRPMTFHSA